MSGDSTGSSANHIYEYESQANAKPNKPNKLYEPLPRRSVQQPSAVLPFELHDELPSPHVRDVSKGELVSG